MLSGQGPRYFYGVHRAFSRALGNIHARLFHASDLYVLPGSRRAAKAKSAQLSFDSRELYANVASTTGRPHVSVFWRAVERRSIRAANHVWTVSEPIARELATRYGIPPPTVQLNAPAIRAVEPTPYVRDQTGLTEETPIILHLGQLRPGRGANLLVDVVGMVPRAHLVFLGYGPEIPKLRSQANRLGVNEHVHFLDPVPPDQVAAAAACADVGVTLLEPTCLNHRLALPNKLFDYMAAGLPVVGSDLPAIGQVIRNYDCGLAVDPLDAEALAAALTRTLTDSPERDRWKRNARVAAETLDWKAVSQEFIEQVNTLIGPPQHP